MLPSNSTKLPSRLGLSDYGEAFIAYLYEKQLVGINNWDKIIEACKKSEEHAIGKMRKNGDVAESHPYEVSKIFVDYHGEKISENGLIASILHDYVEDNSNSEKEHEGKVREIESIFGVEVSILVDLLSKPHFTLFNGASEKEQKEKRNKFYFGNYKKLKTIKAYVKNYFQENNIRGMTSDQISRFAFIVGCIKLSDRIHNLITLDEDTYTIEKMVAKIQETEEYLIPLAHNLAVTHPYVLEQIRDALIKARRRIPGGYEKFVRGQVDATLVRN